MATNINGNQSNNLQKLTNFEQYGFKNQQTLNRGETQKYDANNNGLKGAQQYFQLNNQGSQNNRIGAGLGSGTKTYVSALDPTTFKSQPAPSSSRLKQRSNLTNPSGTNQIDLEPLNSGTNGNNLSSQNKREIDPSMNNPLQTTKALSNASSKIQATQNAGFLNFPRSQSRV